MEELGWFCCEIIVGADGEVGGSVRLRIIVLIMRLYVSPAGFCCISNTTHNGAVQQGQLSDCGEGRGEAITTELSSSCLKHETFYPYL